MASWLDCLHGTSDYPIICSFDYLFNLRFVMKHLLSAIEWKRILQFIITVLTAIVGSLGAQSCL